MTDTDTHVLEWSQKQNAMIIYPIKRAIENNLQSFFANRSSDFIVVSRGTRDECEQVRSSIRHHLQQRESVRKSHDRRRN